MKKSKGLSLMDNELKACLEEIPQRPNWWDFRVGEPNAYVCKDKEGNIEIYHVNGGCIGTKVEYLSGDIAPFCD